MYMAHVHFAETGQREVAQTKLINNKFGEHHEALLKGLFNTINADQRDKIAKADFVSIFQNQEVPSFIERFRRRLMRGQQRLTLAIKERLQEADIRYGANGMIPVSAF